MLAKHWSYESFCAWGWKTISFPHSTVNSHTFQFSLCAPAEKSTFFTNYSKGETLFLSVVFTTSVFQKQQQHYLQQLLSFFLFSLYQSLSPSFLKE